MDNIDLKILHILKHNARKTLSSLSKEVNMSVSAIIERIKKMEIQKIISKYTVIVDQKKIGNDVTAIMEVRLEHPKYFDSFTQTVVNNHNVASCYYMTGDFDFIVRIHCASSEHLEAIHREIKSINGVSATKTQLVLKTLKEDPSVLPSDI